MFLFLIPLEVFLAADFDLVIDVKVVWLDFVLFVPFKSM